eukprot:6146173-Amphidinium_carterae.1
MVSSLWWTWGDLQQSEKAAKSQIGSRVAWVRSSVSSSLLVACEGHVKLPAVEFSYTLCVATQDASSTEITDRPL